MRRLLALSFAAAAIAVAAPAHAGDIVCTPTNQVGVCAGNDACPGRCFPEPYVYSYCVHPVPDRTCDLVLFQIGPL